MAAPSAELDARAAKPDPSAARPRLWPAFFKGHGLGNDYLVVEAGDDWIATPGAVARVCSRHRGVGSDGIVCLVGRPSTDEAGGAWRLRMFNPDGTEFERSGNGLRIFAAYLASRGEVEAERTFPVEVGGDRLRMTVHGDERGGRYDVGVEMGRVRVGPGSVGMEDAESEGSRFVHPALGSLDVVPVSVGNPHCVVFGQPLSAPALESVGPFLETHPGLPVGTNVQLVEQSEAGRIRILIWERGVGETSASGTSACAAAVAAVHRGDQEPGSITVEMNGGALEVRVDAELDVRLRGPVEEICAGRLTAGFLDALEEGRSGPTSGPAGGG